MTIAAFTALLGQPQAVQLLSQAVRCDRVAPAYLFAGPEGVGRSLAARCFATMLLGKVLGQEAAPSAWNTLQHRIAQGNHPDLLWVWPTYQHQGKLITAREAETLGLNRKTPPQIRLEQIRDLSRFVSRLPLEARRSLVVIEQAETMAEAAANALLKTLEEPGTATLILLAPSPAALLPTLVSRCQRIPFIPLAPPDLTSVLNRLGHDAILAQPEILALAEGSPGAAIANRQRLDNIPADLLSQLQAGLPQSPRAALSLAAAIAKALSLEDQVWLLNYLQAHYWQPHNPKSPSLLQHLETARQSLLKYAQPQLVWEVLFLGKC